MPRHQLRCCSYFAPYKVLNATPRIARLCSACISIPRKTTPKLVWGRGLFSISFCVFVFIRGFAARRSEARRLLDFHLLYAILPTQKRCHALSLVLRSFSGAELPYIFASQSCFARRLRRTRRRAVSGDGDFSRDAAVLPLAAIGCRHPQGLVATFLQKHRPIVCTSFLFSTQTIAPVQPAATLLRCITRNYGRAR